MVGGRHIRDLADQIRDEVPPSLVPDEPTGSLFALYAVLALAKGTAVTAEDVHNAWTAWMLTRGEEHESMVPYKDLPESTRREDDPFVRAIRLVAERLDKGARSS